MKEKMNHQEDMDISEIVEAIELYIPAISIIFFVLLVIYLLLHFVARVI